MTQKKICYRYCQLEWMLQIIVLIGFVFLFRSCFPPYMQPELKKESQFVIIKQDIEFIKNHRYSRKIELLTNIDQLQSMLVKRKNFKQGQNQK